MGKNEERKEKKVRTRGRRRNEEKRISKVMKNQGQRNKQIPCNSINKYFVNV